MGRHLLLPGVLWGLLATSGVSCVQGERIPGATPACQSREGPLLGCGPRTGGLPEDSIRAACQKLAACGLVAIEHGGRSFEDCLGDFEGYPIDTLPAILDCIGRSSCEQLPDPQDRNISICERFGR